MAVVTGENINTYMCFLYQSVLHYRRMLSQTFRNPNVELAAAGLFTIGVGFFHLLVGVNWLPTGKPLLDTGTACLVGFTANITGLSALKRTSWGVSMIGYVIAITAVYFLPRDGWFVLLFIVTSVPVLVGAGLYVMLAREEFKTTERPEEVNRPFYN